MYDLISKHRWYSFLKESVHNQEIEFKLSKFYGNYSSIVKLLPQKNDFWATQTRIESASLWWAVRCSNHWATKTQMASECASSTYVRPERQPRYVNNLINAIYMLEMWELEISWMTDECSSSSYLRRVRSQSGAQKSFLRDLLKRYLSQRRAKREATGAADPQHFI